MFTGVLSCGAYAFCICCFLHLVYGSLSICVSVYKSVFAVWACVCVCICACPGTGGQVSTACSVCPLHCVLQVIHCCHTPFCMHNCCTYVQLQIQIKALPLGDWCSHQADSNIFLDSRFQSFHTHRDIIYTLIQYMIVVHSLVCFGSKT